MLTLNNQRTLLKELDLPKEWKAHAQGGFQRFEKRTKFFMSQSMSRSRHQTGQSGGKMGQNVGHDVCQRQESYT